MEFTTGKISWNELGTEATEAEVRDDIEDFLDTVLTMERKPFIEFKLTPQDGDIAPQVEFISEDDGILVDVLMQIEVAIYHNRPDQQLFDTVQKTIKRVEE